MDQDKPKLPNEAIELYNRYIHGEISRRDFLNGVKRFAVAGLTVGRDRRRADAELRRGAAGLQDRRSDQGQLRHRPVAAGQRQHQGLSRASVQRRHAIGDRRQAARHSRRARESRPQSAHRGHRAALRARQLHGVRARRAHLGRRLSRATTARGGELFGKVDGAKKTEDFVAAALWLKARARLHRQDRRHRFLLRRRHRQHAGRPARGRSGGRRAVLRRRSARRGRPEDQGRDSRPSRRARHAAGRGVAGVRHGAEGRQRAARRPHLSGRRPRLQQRRDARTLQQGRGRSRPGSARSTGSTSTCGPEEVTSARRSLSGRAVSVRPG